MGTNEVGAFLNAFYALERNVRIQNAADDQFYGCFPNGSIFLNWGIHPEDFDTPKSSQANGYGWYKAKTLNDVCEWLLKKGLKYNPELTTEITQQHKTNLEEILIQANKSGWKFIIEMVWDSGFDVYLIHKSDNKIKHETCFPAEKIGGWIEQQMHLLNQGIK